jgi:hypothetical protein
MIEVAWVNHPAPSAPKRWFQGFSEKHRKKGEIGLTSTPNVAKSK